MSILISNVKDLTLVAAMNGIVELPPALARHIKFSRQKFKELEDKGLIAPSYSLLNHSRTEEFLRDKVFMCTGLTDENKEEVDVIYYPVSSRQEAGLYALLICLNNDDTLTVGYLYEGGYFVTDNIEYNKHDWLTQNRKWKYIGVSLLNVNKINRHAANTKVLADEFKMLTYYLLTTNSREEPELNDDLLFYGGTPGFNVITGERMQPPGVGTPDELRVSKTPQSLVVEPVEEAEEDQTVLSVTVKESLEEPSGESEEKSIQEMISELTSVVKQTRMEQSFFDKNITQLIKDNHSDILGMTHRLFSNLKESNENEQSRFAKKTTETLEEGQKSILGMTQSLLYDIDQSMKRLHIAFNQQSNNANVKPAAVMEPIEVQTIDELRLLVNKLADKNLKLTEEIAAIKQTLARFETAPNEKDNNTIFKATQFIDSVLIGESKDK